jgi:hypothetical protein
MAGVYLKLLFNECLLLKYGLRVQVGLGVDVVELQMVRVERESGAFGSRK